MNAKGGLMCDARHDDLTSIICNLFKGHPGDHEGISFVTWPAEDGDDSA